MNRLLTSLVQLALLVPALIGVRAMWEWLKEDMRELTRQARRVDLTLSDRPAVFCGRYPQLYTQVWKTPET